MGKTTQFGLLLNRIAILMVIICLLGLVCAFTACDDNHDEPYVEPVPREVVIEVINPNSNEVLSRDEHIDYPGENTKIEVRIKDAQTGAYILDSDLPETTVENSLSVSVLDLSDEQSALTSGIWPSMSDTTNNHFEITAVFDCSAGLPAQNAQRKYERKTYTTRFYYNEKGDDTINVESISIRFEDGNEIGLTESKRILTDVLPIDATDKSYEYVIEKIERANGELYTDDLAKYARIEHDTIYTTREIEVGSQIYFHAETVDKAVVSGTLTARIVRIGIERVELFAPYWQSDIDPGEELELTLKIFPENATVNILNDRPIHVSLGNSEIATLEKVSDRKYMLRAIDDGNIAGQEINISVGVENINKSVSFVVNAIPIESMIILNADTGVELDDVTYLTRGASMNLVVEITPQNATIRNKHYHLSSPTTANSSAYANIDENGRLTITENAPLNMELDMSATVIGSSTKMYKIIILPREVESVVLSADQDYIVKGSTLIFTRTITPENFDLTSSTEYKLVEEVPGVYISANRVYASSEAETNAVIKIIAIVNGVESNVLILTIVDEPPTT